MNAARAITAAMLLVAAASASAKDSYVYGPAPDWERYRELGEAAVKAKLPDPDKYAIEWPNGYMQGGWRHKGEFSGYLSCGRTRALSPVGDRNPVTNFVIVIDYDKVATVDFSDRYSNSLVNVICAAYVKTGELPPAPTMTAPRNLSVPALGLTILPMPEGAYVARVSDGGSGANAGLKPGMVITRVNGIPLAGMNDTMARLLAGDAAVLTLETATGAKMDVKRMP